MGSFIVGVENGTKTTVLDVMKDELAWVPRDWREHVLDRMPMFAGGLDQAQLVWLLHRPEVQSIESDGSVGVTVASPGGGGPGGPPMAGHR